MTDRPASRGFRRVAAFALAGLGIALLLGAAWVASQAGGDVGAERWIRDALPEAFVRVGPKGLKWWQWLAFPVLTMLSWVIGRALGAITRTLLQRFSRRTKVTWDDRLLASAEPAFTTLWAVAIFRMLLPWLGLGAQAQSFVHSGLAATVVITTFLALWRSVSVLVGVLVERPWAVDNPSARSLLEIAGNFAKAGVAIAGVVTTIGAFGYPVATALAGLGIGGIALALGAQKTVENVFGSVTLAADQPCRVGDFVKIADFTGTVEQIAIRSTRIRTLDRSLVTIPNGRLADMPIETFAARDRIRFATVLGLGYDTTEAQLRRVLADVEQLLRQHPRIWQDTRVVRLAAFGAAAIEIEVICWFETADYEVFRGYRQELLFSLMRVVADAGASFGHPARPVRLVAEAAPRAD